MANDTVGPREGDHTRTTCYCCHGAYRDCRFTKAAHVTVFAWVCSECREGWAGE